jgi:hypothetical protein
LERFCALWSAMVPINRTEDPFRKGAEWVNVYDPTDPVGTWISDFDPLPTPVARPGHAKLTPRNFPCRSSPILLLSHICYLTVSRLRSLRVVTDRQHLLVNLVADWLVHGGSLADRIEGAPKGIGAFWIPLDAPGVEPYWQTRPRVFWRFIQWAIAGAAFTALTLLSLHYVIYPLAQQTYHFLTGNRMVAKLMSQNWWSLGAAWRLWLVTIIVVLVASIIHYVWSTMRRQKIAEKYQRRSPQTNPRLYTEWHSRRH